MQGGNGAKMCKPQLGILGGIRGFKLVSNCAFQRLQQGRPKAAKHASWRNTVFKGNFESEQNAMSGICYTASPLQRFISTLRCPSHRCCLMCFFAHLELLMEGASPHAGTLESPCVAASSAFSAGRLQRPRGWTGALVALRPVPGCITPLWLPQPGRCGCSADSMAAVRSSAILACLLSERRDFESGAAAEATRTTFGPWTLRPCRLGAV